MNERLESMTRPRASILACTLALAFVLTLSGCSKRRADAAPAAPPAPVPASAPPVKPPPGPLSEPQTRAELPAPQAVPEGAAPAPRGPFAYEAPEAPEEKPQPKTARPAARPVAEAPPPAAEPAAEPPSSATVPQLGPLISDQQRQVFQAEIDRNLAQAKASIDSLMGRRLTDDQAEGVRRIREFLRQVEESRGNDAALARNLSERARLLAEDLVRNVR